MAVNHRFCVKSSFLKALVLKPNTFRVAISRSISVNDNSSRLYKTITAKREAKNISMRELGLLILQTGLQKNDYFPKSQNGQKWEVEETVVVMFTFEKCTYDELQVIRYEADLLLSGWTMLEKEYIDETFSKSRM